MFYNNKRCCFLNGISEKEERNDATKNVNSIISSSDLYLFYSNPCVSGKITLYILKESFFHNQFIKIFKKLYIRYPLRKYQCLRCHLSRKIYYKNLQFLHSFLFLKNVSNSIFCLYISIHLNYIVPFICYIN